MHLRLHVVSAIEITDDDDDDDEDEDDEGSRASASGGGVGRNFLRFQYCRLVKLLLSLKAAV